MKMEYLLLNAAIGQNMLLPPAASVLYFLQAYHTQYTQRGASSEKVGQYTMDRR
jgi:hypothetical protein